MTKYGPLPYCAYCHEPIVDNRAEMHEVLLTRGNVQGNEELLPEIMVRYNCVLVHPACHKNGNTDLGRRRSIAHLITNENVVKIARWLGHMAGLMKTGAPEEALNLLIEVHDEMSNMSEGLRTAYQDERDKVCE